jgi:hypothetical protein
VRSNRLLDFANVGDQCVLIMDAFRTLIRFSALSHKEEPIRSLSVSFVAVCGETWQKCRLHVIRQALATIHSENGHQFGPTQAATRMTLILA